MKQKLSNALAYVLSFTMVLLPLILVVSGLQGIGLVALGIATSGVMKYIAFIGAGVLLAYVFISWAYKY